MFSKMSLIKKKLSHVKFIQLSSVFFTDLARQIYPNEKNVRDKDLRDAVGNVFSKCRRKKSKNKKMFF